METDLFLSSPEEFRFNILINFLSENYHNKNINKSEPQRPENMMKISLNQSLVSRHKKA